MKTNIKNKLATGLMGALAVVTMTAAIGMAPATVDAVACPPGTKNQTADNYALCNMDPSQTSANSNIWDTVNTIINVLLGVIGIVAVIMVIYGGFKIVTSAGAADKVKSGKETILYGVVGLIIALLAFAIVNFVVKSFFSNDAASNNTNNTSSSSSSGDTRVNNGNSSSPQPVNR